MKNFYLLTVSMLFFAGAAFSASSEIKGPSKENLCKYRCIGKTKKNPNCEADCLKKNSSNKSESKDLKTDSEK